MESSDIHEMKAAEILDKAFSIYKLSFWVQIAYGVLANIISAIAMFALCVVFFIVAMTLGVSVGIFGFNSVNSIAMVVIVAIIIFIFVFFGILLLEMLKTTGMISITKQIYDGESPNLTKAFNFAFSNLLRVSSAIIAELICLSPIIIAAIVLEAVVFIAIINPFELVNYYNLGLFEIIICLIIPVIASIAIFIFDTFWSLAVPIAAFEKIKFFKALKKSKKLIQGSYKQIIGIRIISGISLMCFNYAILIIVYIAIAGFNSSLDLNEEVYAIVNILAQNIFLPIIILITSPISSILTFVLYYNQKVKKEGLDIQFKIEELSSLGDTME